MPLQMRTIRVIVGSRACPRIPSHVVRPRRPEDRRPAGVPAVIVCVCHRVSDRDIEREVRHGCASFEELQDELRVATACGRCAECAYDTFEAARACRPVAAVGRVIPIAAVGSGVPLAA